jgi:BirA family biotin operon repressor/biotin-[acetyl-CoA-carboxylase] ligase
MKKPVFLYKQITNSTMEDAREALRNGYGHATVCSAGTQRKGRGRVNGRIWQDNGESVLFTFIIDKNSYRAAYPVTQAASYALIKYLENHHGIRGSIKWPNDVLVEGRKTAGILAEAEGGYYLIGIGVNINQQVFKGSYRTEPVSLAMLYGDKNLNLPDIPGTAGLLKKFDTEKELKVLVNELFSVLENPPRVNLIESHLMQLGKEVKVHLGDPSGNSYLNGTVEGLAEDGALIIFDENGDKQLVYSGELD